MKTVPQLLFIPGMTRSGTTWISNWLDLHPELVSIREGYLVRHMLDLLNHEPDIGRVVTVEQARSFLSEVYGTVSNGKRYLLDKSPADFRYKNSDVMQTIFELFPDARVLWLLRDGKAFVSAVMNLPWVPRPPWTIERAIRVWITNAEYLLSLPRTPQIFVQRYEDLLKFPEKSREITSFFQLSHHQDIQPWVEPTNTIHQSPDEQRWLALGVEAHRLMREMNPLLEKLGYSIVS